MSALTKEEDEIKRRIAELQQQLKEVEVKTAVGGKSSVMNTMSTESAANVGRLGPSVFAEIWVNGVPVKALVDTGSPATIVSLDFILDILAAQRKSQQTPEQWRVETLEKFNLPDISLKNYGGHPLNIISQIRLCLSQGSHVVDATVLVQKEALNKLLLGNDIQSKLGFVLVVELRRS